jgi:hypothetical protein
VCVAGTRWVQTELLQKYPTAHLRVYAIWFNMFPGDARAKWPAALLSDARVIHRWDEPKTVGTWYAARAVSMRPHLTPGSTWGDGAVLWDSFLVYGEDSHWDDAPTHLIHWGRPIVAGRETLREDFEKLFASNGSLH